MAIYRKISDIRVSKTEYLYVSEMISRKNGLRKPYWKVIFRKGALLICFSDFVSAKNAAKRLDVKLIEASLQPINILKPKIRVKV